MTTDTQTHTPGPWHRIEDMAENRIYIGRRLYDGAIRETTLVTVNNCIMEGEANARLIAAAPDLLAALEAIEQIARRQSAADADPSQDAWSWASVGQSAIAAIRKATSEDV